MWTQSRTPSLFIDPVGNSRIGSIPVSQPARYVLARPKGLELKEVARSLRRLVGGPPLGERQQCACNFLRSGERSVIRHYASRC